MGRFVPSRQEMNEIHVCNNQGQTGMDRVYNRRGKEFLPYMNALDDFQLFFGVIQQRVAELENKIHEVCLKFREIHTSLPVNGPPIKTDRDKVVLNVANSYIDRLEEYIEQTRNQLGELESFKLIGTKSQLRKNDLRIRAKKMIEKYVSSKTFYLGHLTELVKNHAYVWKC
jgi:cob(I)alamin adenosyltransferase